MFSPGTLASSLCPKTCRSVRESKFPIGVNVSGWLFVSLYQPCDELVTFPFLFIYLFSMCGCILKMSLS